MDKTVLDINTREEFRNWLMNNSDKETECFVYVKKGKPVDECHLWYLDAVEEALCFGWIDSTNVHVNGRIAQRFTPRRKNGLFTELNKERVRRLEALGLMTDMGRKVLPKMGKRSFKIPYDIERALKDARVWSKFKKFPELYRNIRAYNIAFAKRLGNGEYEKALNHLIEMTKENKMYGEWNDYGRLLKPYK